MLTDSVRSILSIPWLGEETNHGADSKGSPPTPSQALLRLQALGLALLRLVDLLVFTRRVGIVSWHLVPVVHQSVPQ